MNQPLNDLTQKVLREEMIITDSEVAFQIGDKYIAENILNKSRREIYVPTRLLETVTNKRVLKG